MSIRALNRRFNSRFNSRFNGRFNGRWLRKLFGRVRGRIPNRRFLLIALLSIGALAVALLTGHGDADARPGGGQSYSGGGSGGSGGGGGGGGGGQLVMLVMRLIIVYPHVGIPLAIILIVGFVFFRRQHETTEAADWDSVDLIEEPQTRSAQLSRITSIDPKLLGGRL